ncbi:hypothetical protein DYB32_006149, partial [Aphanomyces invadans]
GHYYAMQEKAWMDASLWHQYLWFVLAKRVTAKSLLVLDNFDSHVSNEGVEAAAEEGYEVCPLPTNAASHCQPLDVSIMAPFKRHLRDLWTAEDMVSTPDGDDEEYWMSPASRINRTTMIKRAILAWERITPDQHRASFLKAIPQPLKSVFAFISGSRNFHTLKIGANDRSRHEGVNETDLSEIGAVMTE